MVVIYSSFTNYFFFTCLFVTISETNSQRIKVNKKRRVFLCKIKE